MYTSYLSNSIEINQSDLFEGIFVARCTNVSIPGKSEEIPKGYGYIQMFFVVKGCISLKCNGMITDLFQNDIYFIFPGNEYYIINSSSEQANIIYLDLYGSSLSKVLELLDITLEKATVKGVQDPNVLRELHNISLLSGRLSVSESFRSLSSLYQILAVLIDQYSPHYWTIVSYNNPSIYYYGDWKVWPLQNSREMNTVQEKSYAEYNFFGNGVKWFGNMNYNCGLAEILIDGVLQTTIDTYNSTRLVQQLLYCNTSLDNTYHVIRIVCNGNRNEKSTDNEISIVGFQSLSNNSHLSEEADKKLNSNSLLIINCLNYIKSSYNTNISIDMLADELEVSRSYLTTRFKAETGFTISKYIVNMRMTRAKTLLASTDQPINDIAISIGYQDVFYFSKTFKKNIGISPTEYRIQNAFHLSKE